MYGGSKQALCRNWTQSGRCRFGRSCHLAHGEHERALGPEPGTDGPAPIPFTYSVGAWLDEQEYLRLFKDFLPPGLELPAYQGTDEEDRKRLPWDADRATAKQQQDEALHSPGSSAPGFSIQLDRQERPVLCATHYRHSSLGQLQPRELGRVLDCLADRMSRLATRPQLAVAQVPGGVPPGIIQCSCNQKKQGGWMRSWNLTLKAQVPVAEFLPYARRLLQGWPLQLAAMADAEYYQARRQKDLQQITKEELRPYHSNWVKILLPLSVAAAASPLGAPAEHSAAAPAQDDLPAAFQRISLSRSTPATTSSTAEQPAAVQKSDTATRAGGAQQEADAGNAEADPGPGPGPSAEDFLAHFYQLPLHLQPGQGSGVQWFGCRQAPVLLAVPQAAHGSAAALNGFSAEAAARHAQAFAEHFRVQEPGYGGRMPPPPAQKGFGLFFVPLYVQP